MSQNTTKDNPLLFSANIASPFDDLSASTVILPPQNLELQKSIEKKEDSNVVKENDSSKLVVASSNPISVTSNILPSKPISDLISGPPAPPPLSRKEDGSSLRRPISKYVVPPDFATKPVLPPPSNLPPSFNPRPSLPPINSTLNPAITSYTPPFPTMKTSSAPSTNTFAPPPPSFSSTIPPANTIIQPLSSMNSSSIIPPSNMFSPSKPANTTYSPPTISPSVSSVSVPGLVPSANSNLQSAFNPLSHSTVIPDSFDKMASNPPLVLEVYHPVIHHWFYSEGKSVTTWKPFSFTDSINLEAAFKQGSVDKVACDGGRYDAVVPNRLRSPVYWEDDPGPIRRCSWFRKGYADPLPIPYPEDVADRLEHEYREAVTTGRWHRQVELPDGERVMMNSPHSIHHYQLQSAETAASVSESPTPLTVKRGTDEFSIPDGGSPVADHLLFLIHGIGSVCDLQFRSVEECVSEFRCMGEELVTTHFRSSVEAGSVSRVEVLPISWHKELHGDSTGLDARVRQITLRSIPKFREFTNDTLLDVLYYTSPVYCQHIMDTVASEMERLLALFRSRNPSFSGSVSVGGHSLGSVILFDLLAHQNPSSVNTGTTITKADDEGKSVEGVINPVSATKRSLEVGKAGTGQPTIVYPQLSFKPRILFLLGSPVAMFITVRGIDNLGPDFQLPTCDRVFNVFHPFDPVAYRLETLIDPSFNEFRPVLIPHHKGRKRMHLELKDTIERVGSDLKNKIVDSIHSTWNKFWQIYAGNQSDSSFGDRLDESSAENKIPSPIEGIHDRPIGRLNGGRRIDYVLQEKPYESFTEYIFALQAHVSYWNSEDTMLMMLKEIYHLDGVVCDTKQNLQSQSSESNANDAFKKVPSDGEIDASSNSEPLLIPNLNYDVGKPTPEFTSPPVPLFSPPNTLNSIETVPLMMPPPLTGFKPVSGSVGRTLRGRPVFDPLKAPINAPGMDPTATPLSDKPLPPPPTSTNVNFSQKGS